ncbi:DsbA family protein [Bifidobacterium callitrichidarum]|uniref:DsbA family protein n=1 Tax=Bifidobacterium callitrichidarum TaxID=2052941 RepID=UPI0013048AF6|nr:thioredoxin domain-containing protein [Bifidobacterium callitrichidarum]
MSSKKTSKKTTTTDNVFEQPFTEKERRQQTVIGAVVVAIIAIIVFVGGFFLYQNLNADKIAQAKVAEESELAYQKLQNDPKPKYATKDGAFIISNRGYNQPIKNVPTVGVYLEPLCPGCANVERTLGSTFQSLVKNGQINLEVHFMTFQDNKSSDDYSTRAMNGAINLTQYDKNPQHLLKYLSNIFAENFQPGELSSYKSVSTERLKQQAIDAGVKKQVADRAFKDDSNWQTWLKTADTYTFGRTELYAKGNDSFSTPTITIDGKRWNAENMTTESLLSKLGIPSMNTTTEAR